jgi:hypothetical protein
MIGHIKQLIQQVQIVKTEHPKDGVVTIKDKSGLDIHNLFTAVTEELAKLDPQDFAAGVRHEFTALRIRIRDQYSHGKILDSHKAADDAARMSEILDSYAGAGSGGQTRSFTFITNSDIRAIVERDYEELTQRAFPGGSWKSSVILAGSILEAVLFDVLTKDAAAIHAAMNNPETPQKSRRAGGGPKDIMLTDRDNQWSLNDFIKVACNLGILPYDDEQAIHLVLREYRNLVHPRLELQLGIPISKSHAGTAVNMLDVILDILK